MSGKTHAQERLKSFVERLERLEAEIDALNRDKAEVYAEAKGEGFDTKVMRQVIRRRKLDRAEKQEMDAILDLYESALDGAAREKSDESLDPFA